MNALITKLIRSTGYSMDGLRAAWRDESSFRLELRLCLLLVPLSLWLEATPAGHALMLASLLLVLLVELLNTAIEATIERISPEIHPQSKKAKDAGSAAVTVALAIVVAVWGCVLLG